MKNIIENKELYFDDYVLICLCGCPSFSHKEKCEGYKSDGNTKTKRCSCKKFDLAIDTRLENIIVQEF